MPGQSGGARIREFGVRAAVGASSGDLSGLILRDALLLTAPGLGAGVIPVPAFAPVSMAAAFVLLLASMAAWLTAKRASAVDPAVALPSE